MKKVTTIIGAVCMMGLLTFVSTSCKKNEGKADMTIQVVIPQAEEESFDGERAYLNPQGVFFWSKNDQVRVYNLAENANADQSQTSLFHKVGGTNQDALAYFQGPSVGPKQALAYRLFYPYNMVEGTEEEIEAKLQEQENRQSFVVAKKQYYSFYETEQHMKSLIDPAAMPMATRIEKLNGPATLEHIFGFLKFAVGANPGENIVVDSIKLIDNMQHLTGKVTCQISNVVDGDGNGQLDVNDVWNEFFNRYHGYTPEFVQDVLRPIYQTLSWVPEPTGYEITLDCVYQHEDGEVKGVQLRDDDGYNYFTFVVRPGACWNGFNLIMYVHNNANPTQPIEVVIDRWNGNIPATPGMVQPDDMVGQPNYLWTMAPRKIKTFTYPMPVSSDMFH